MKGIYIDLETAKKLAKLDKLKKKNKIIEWRNTNERIKRKGNNDFQK